MSGGLKSVRPWKDGLDALREIGNLYLNPTPNALPCPLVEGCRAYETAAFERSDRGRANPIAYLSD